MAILDNITYIPSAGIAPKYPNKTQSAKRIQKKILKIGLNWDDLTEDLSSQGITNKTAIEPNINRTPPNLSGIALRIA